MNRKGDLSPSMRIVVYVVVLLIFVFATMMIVSGKVGDTKTKTGSVDPSSGGNSAKLVECQKKCGASYSEAACTNADPQLNGISCRTFLENLANALDIAYPDKLGAGPNRVVLTVKSASGGPVSGADISGQYVVGQFSEGPAGTYTGTVDTTNVPLTEGKGYVTLYIKPADLPSRTVPILVESGSAITTGGEAGGGAVGGGGAGAAAIVLQQNGAGISQIDYTLPVAVMVKKADGSIVAPAPASTTVGLKDISNNVVNCGLPGNPQACILQNSNTFTIPYNALKDGSYSIYITAKDPATNNVLTLTQPFSWACPPIIFDSDKPFGPSKTMVATFESPVSDLSKVIITLNGNANTITNKQIVAGNNKAVSFKIPLLNSGVIEGDNKLRAERNNEGLCIKFSADQKKDVVKNFADATYPWSCPDAGCYQQGGKDYTLSTKDAGGSYSDYLTGCRYSNKAATPCTSGCADGACKAPALEISTVKLDGVEIGTATIYEDANNDRIIAVTVKNTGSLTANDVDAGISAKLDSTNLQNILAAPKQINAGQTADYSFALPKGTPKIPLGSTSVSAQLSVEVKASNTPTSTTWQSTLTFNACGTGCTSYDTTVLCGKCSACKWDANKSPKCQNKCVLSCNSYTPADCGITCAACTWSAVDNKCVPA